MRTGVERNGSGPFASFVRLRLAPGKSKAAVIPQVRCLEGADRSPIAFRA